MTETLQTEDLFDPALIYPDPDARERLASLVGLHDHKDRLFKILTLLVAPSALWEWSDRFHNGASSLLDTILARPPLIVLEGDVGCGKSALAESIGDSVARERKIDITLFPMSLSARGQGRVGEMTQLLSAAFDRTYTEASKLAGVGGEPSRGAVILLIDEADALAQSREAAQMHHEDRAGVNALIRGVDRLAKARCRWPSSCVRTGSTPSTRPCSGAPRTSSASVGRTEGNGARCWSIPSRSSVCVMRKSRESSTPPVQRMAAMGATVTGLRFRI